MQSSSKSHYIETNKPNYRRLSSGVYKLGNLSKFSNASQVMAIVLTATFENTRAPIPSLGCRHVQAADTSCFQNASSSKGYKTQLGSPEPCLLEKGEYARTVCKQGSHCRRGKTAVELGFTVTMGTTQKLHGK